jgi:hypothetical protein
MLELAATIAAAAENCLKISDGATGVTRCDECKKIPIGYWNKKDPNAWQDPEAIPPLADHIESWNLHTCTQFVQAQIGQRQGFIVVTRLILPQHKLMAKTKRLAHFNLPFCVPSKEVSIN